MSEGRVKDYATLCLTLVAIVGAWMIWQASLVTTPIVVLASPDDPAAPVMPTLPPELVTAAKAIRHQPGSHPSSDTHPSPYAWNDPRGPFLGVRSGDRCWSSLYNANSIASTSNSAARLSNNAGI